MASKPLQVGDRVRAFGIFGFDGWHSQIDGTVVEVRHDPPRICFKGDVVYEGREEHFVAMPQQCRRLRPRRKARRAWLNPQGVLLSVKADETDDRVWGQGPWTEFREVRPKRKERKPCPK